MSTTHNLYERAEHACELCKSTENPQPHTLQDSPEDDSKQVLLCQTCRELIQDLDESADNKHWRCLQDSIWSITPEVQVLSWRLLHTLSSTQSWARDALDQAYLEDELLEWAKSTISEAPKDDTPPTYDANGTQLQEGDSITLVRNLDVKGGGFTAKQGTLVKNIRLTGDPDYIEGKINGMSIMLKTKFIKRA